MVLIIYTVLRSTYAGFIENIPVISLTLDRLYVLTTLSEQVRYTQPEICPWTIQCSDKGALRDAQLGR
jgi:hypothetical protein